MRLPGKLSKKFKKIFGKNFPGDVRRNLQFTMAWRNFHGRLAAGILEKAKTSGRVLELTTRKHANKLMKFPKE